MRIQPFHMRKFARLTAIVSMLLSLFCLPALGDSNLNPAISKQLQFEDKQLLLNGSGIRSKFFFDLYLAGLYLETTTSDANVILSQDTAIAIRIFVLSDLITSDKLIKGTREGFYKSTQGKPQAIQTEIDALLSAFEDTIKPDDVFDIVYLPGKGVQVIKNGLFIKQVNSDKTFRTALFGIWLGKDPAQESLKKALLHQ